MEIEKIDNRHKGFAGLAAGFAMLTAILALIGFCLGIAHGAQIVDWSRVTGRVVKIDQRANVLTIVNDGFPLTIKLDADASIVDGKRKVDLSAVRLGQTVAIVNMPPAPAPLKAKDEDAPVPPGGWK
jgi:hypothetical protein